MEALRSTPVRGLEVALPLRSTVSYRMRDGGWYRATRKFNGVTVIHNTERVR